MLDKGNTATALSRLSYILYVRYMKAIPSHEPNSLTNTLGLYSCHLNRYIICGAIRQRVLLLIERLLVLARAHLDNLIKIKVK